VEDSNDLKKQLEELRRRNQYLEERERDLEERNEELQAQKEELTAAIEAFIVKSDSLAETNQQLQERNFELDQVLYRTSHDLRSPISSIEGIVNILRQQTDSAEVKQMHQFLMQKVLQMNDVLNSLGTLAHASFDGLKLEQVRLKDVTEKAISELEYLPNYKHCCFTVNIPDATTIETDAFLFSILLKSLLANSIIFRDSNEKGYVEVGTTHQPHFILLTVTDNGEGILSEVQSRIFDMFFRGSERSVGSGLGLYIAKRLVERFNGTISFQSEAGKTTFEVVLPA
jgi:signal transduction histidine kinase